MTHINGDVHLPVYIGKGSLSKKGHLNINHSLECVCSSSAWNRATQQFVLLREQPFSLSRRKSTSQDRGIQTNNETAFFSVIRVQTNEAVRIVHAELESGKIEGKQINKRL